MTPLEKQIKEKQYQDYVKQHTPVHNVWTNMLKAFLTGGSICTLGQLVSNYCKTLGLSEKDCGAWTAIVLVLFSVILTGLNVYSKIANWGGAGALVPITGFANSVAAPAIEYKKEGQVFGIGAKIFTIAGPVLLYGVVTSWALGVVYWVICWVVAA
ncbi:stage V sporulation protein AC [uncultured Clostridium sp.]|nr:stage V sporulation protein AC [uncultured Clostridium sp.]